MEPTSSELALCLINDNTEAFPYERRLDIAREMRDPHHREISARQWANELALYADEYELNYGEPIEGGVIFSTADVLLAAAEVAEYYAEHDKEMSAT